MKKFQTYSKNSKNFLVNTQTVIYTHHLYLLYQHICPWTHLNDWLVYKIIAKTYCFSATLKWFRKKKMCVITCAHRKKDQNKTNVAELMFVDSGWKVYGDSVPLLHLFSKLRIRSKWKFKMKTINWDCKKNVTNQMRMFSGYQRLPPQVGGFFVAQNYKWPGFYHCLIRRVTSLLT